MKPEQAIEIYKSEKEKFNATRQIQWKFNIAVWSLLVAAIYFFQTKTTPLKNETIIFIFIGAVFITGHFVFIRLIQNSLSTSKMICANILDQLNRDVTSIKVKIGEVRFTNKDFYWIMIQLSTTAVLCVVLLASA